MKKVPVKIKVLAFVGAIPYYWGLHREKGWGFKTTYNAFIEYLITFGEGYNLNGRASQIKENEDE